jgi:glycerol kinase
MIENVKDVKHALDEGRLSFGTVDSWIMYNLTGGINGGVHVTDPTNASRTLLLDIHSLTYSDTLIKFFGLDGVKLPEIKSSAEVYGTMTTGELKGIRLAGCLGDQSAALVGHRGFEKGSAKNTYGTGCFLLFNTGTEPVFSDNGLLTTVGFAFSGQKPVYALEGTSLTTALTIGSIAVAGSAIKWARDQLGIIKSSNEIGELASKVDGTYIDETIELT